MVVVRSVSGVMMTDFGSEACKLGSKTLIASATWMTLAPGCRCTFKRIAGVRSIQAPSWTSSAPSTASATSDSSTGRPLL